MELQQLRYFRSAARLQHMTRAATEQGVAQPSLSKAIRILEDELGVALFDRKGPSVRLNASGKAFLRHVDSMFRALDDGTRELEDLSSSKEGELAISAVALRWAAGVFKGFALKHPGIRFRLYQRTPDEMIRQLARREVDLCLMTDPGVDEIEWSPLVSGDLFAVVPPGHWLEGKEGTRFRAFLTEPVILPRAGGPLRNLIDGCYEKEGASPNMVCESDDVSAMTELGSMGLGIQFLPDLSGRLAKSGDPSYVRIIDPPQTVTVGIAWSVVGYRSKAAQSFSAFARSFVKAAGVR